MSEGMDWRFRERLSLGVLGQQAMDCIRNRAADSDEEYDSYAEATVLALLQIVEELRRDRR